MSYQKSPTILYRSVSSASSSSNDEEVELTEEDKEIAMIYELEQFPEIAGRYTEEDPDFAEEMASTLPPPPVLTPWCGPRQFQGGGQGRGDAGRSNFDHNRKRPYEDDQKQDSLNQAKRQRNDDNRNGPNNQGYQNRDRQESSPWQESNQQRHSAPGASRNNQNQRSFNYSSR